MKEPKTYLSTTRIIATDEFIRTNNLKLRSQEEILERYKEIQSRNLFMDFSSEIIVNYLTFENAKPFLKPEYVSLVESGTEKWEATIDTIKECAQDFLDYMNFAWGKAEDERGISASRSIQKLGIWLWLMNREDLALIIHDDSLYNPYGAPALITVCEEMDIRVPVSLREFAKHKCTS